MPAALLIIDVQEGLFRTDAPPADAPRVIARINALAQGRAPRAHRLSSSSTKALRARHWRVARQAGAWTATSMCIPKTASCARPRRIPSKAPT